MSDSSSANSNSWTLLATEENVAETLRPVAEGIENHTDILGPATLELTGEMGDGKGAVPAERERSEESWQAPQEVTGSQEVDLERVEDTISHVQHNTSDPAHDPNLAPDPAHDPNLTPNPVGDVPSSSSVEVTNPDPAHDSHMTPDPTSVTNDHLPSSLEIPVPSNPDLDTASQLAGSSESQAPPSPDPDSFSESYTHISPSAEEGSGFLLTETLGAEEEAELIQEGEAVHQLNGEELGQEEEESELSQRVTEDGKQAVKLVDQLVRDLFHIWARKLAGQAVSVPSGVWEEWAGDGREESEVRRRRRGSLLAALERIGRRDEEEEEEDLRLPQREEEETGFSLNKCILGAIILLGLGTIFFSEGEYDVREMRDADVTGKHEWLNPEVPPPPVDVDNPELLNKPSEENLHVSVLQAQLQAQKEELKVAQGQAAEGAKERVRREEVEKENGRLKKDTSSLPVLLKENEKMKRDLASVPALQREVERLRATVTELKNIPASDTTSPPGSPAAAPSPGPVEDSSLNTDRPADEEVRTLREGEGKEKKKKDWMAGNEWKKEEPGQGKRGKEGWKEQGEKKLREGGKKDWKPENEWKKGKRDKESDGQGGKKMEKKEWKGKEEKTGEWKKERESRGDEGKPWKNREERKEGRGKSERKDWKKGENMGEGKEWKGKSEKKEKKGGKRYVDGNEGKGGEEWRHEKDWGKRHKDKGERKQWKGDKDWKKKDGGREWKGEETRPWQGKEMEGSREGDRKKERRGETWRQEGGSHHRGKDEHKHDKHEKSHHGFTEREGGKKELWHGPGEKSPPPTHRRPPLEQPNYWLLQRERLQHNPSPQAKCTSVETCAQAEGLLPVPLPEFEALLLGYLAKAERVGVEASRREELRKLATEFFKDGVFAHDQMSFRDFVEDLGEILEDMVDGEEDEDEDEDEEEGGIEEEMDGFDDEAMKKFAVPGGGEKVEKKRGERMKEAGRGHG
ncbi:pre-B-cell leukemia homeobox interacting protein 1b isoform X2 [Osmerus eperlanus]|uniref:pre-B-cell leukemia homeobox interacting protein 1b isoform X2 n=1 Tax=Osmerus eperlanus TaxID=29151 RepID=UPI002E14727C